MTRITISLFSILFSTGCGYLDGSSHQEQENASPSTQIKITDEQIKDQESNFQKMAIELAKELTAAPMPGIDSQRFSEVTQQIHGVGIFPFSEESESGTVASIQDANGQWRITFDPLSWSNLKYIQRIKILFYHYLKVTGEKLSFPEAAKKIDPVEVCDRQTPIRSRLEETFARICYRIEQKDLDQIYHLEIDMEHSKKISEIDFRYLSQLKTLKLTHLWSYNLKGDIFSDLKELRHLSITQGGVGHLHKGVLDSLTKLELLDLRGNDICHIDNYTFKNLNSLKRLELTNNAPIHITTHLLSGLTSAEYISFPSRDDWTDDGNMIPSQFLKDVGKDSPSGLVFRMNGNLYNLWVSDQAFEGIKLQGEFALVIQNIKEFGTQFLQNIDAPQVFLISDKISAVQYSNIPGWSCSNERRKIYQGVLCKKLP